MVLIEYRMQLLNMGNFTCAAIGAGGIVIGGCAVSGFRIGVVIPRHCFKFGLGEKAYLADGSPILIVKIRTEHCINFYQIDQNGMFIELPESHLFNFSEYLAFTGLDTHKIEQRLEDLMNKPSVADPLPGSTKVPSSPTFNISAAEMLRDKFLIQIQKLADTIHIPTPSPGKQIFVVEDQNAFLLADALEAKEKLFEDIDILNDCIKDIPPDFIVPGPEGVHITEMDGGIKMNGCAFYVPPPGHCC